MSERDRALQCLDCLTSLLLGPLALIHHTHPLSSIAKSLIPAIGRRRPPEERDGGYERDDSTYDDVNRGNMADGSFRLERSGERPGLANASSRSWPRFSQRWGP